MENRLYKKGLVLGVIVLFVGAGVIPSISGTIGNLNELNSKQSIGILNRGILYVGGSGPNNYTRIQDAIDNASDGDTVFVLDDSSPYCENVVVDKSINLFGENKYSTVIDGMHESHVIELKADEVYIRGFTIKNGGSHSKDAGIYSYSGITESIRVEQNIITENRFGIYLVRPDSCIFSNNTIISNSVHGLQVLIGNNLTIFGNEAIDNDANGINCIQIDNSTISYNIATGNDIGICIQSNNFNILISNNVIIDNNHPIVGLQLTGCKSCTVRNNIIGNGAMWEIYLVDVSFNDSIYHNDVYGTAADDIGASMWDDGYPSGGNYWSGYDGEDNYKGPNQDIPGSDGIGDTPYYFDGNKDRYPLMELWIENLAPIAKFTYSVDGNLVIFDASSSYDLDGTIVSYEWDFGDGTTGMGKIVSHGYNKSGTYDVTLKVTDDYGENDTTSWGVILFLIPGLSCEGSLRWTDVKPGETVESNFTVQNIGDPYSLLDWEIENSSIPSWGEWIFVPESGEHLSPEDSPVTVNVTVVAPSQKNRQFYGTIKVYNKDDTTDYCEIHVYLETPKNKAFNFNFNLLAWLFERFPLLYRLVHILGC